MFVNMQKTICCLREEWRHVPFFLGTLVRACVQVIRKLNDVRLQGPKSAGTQEKNEGRLLGRVCIEVMSALSAVVQVTDSEERGSGKNSSVFVSAARCHFFLVRRRPGYFSFRRRKEPAVV